MRTAMLVSMHHLARWSGPVGPEGTAESLPYGMQRVRDHFDLIWTDAAQSGLWERRAARAVGGAVRRAAPGLQGSASAFYALRKLDGADVVLSVFENVGLGFSRLQRLHRRANMVPHVMVVCWLAEDCEHMSRRQLRSVRRSICPSTRIVVFSANQVAVLGQYLELPPDQISVVPFGVDTHYYDPSLVDVPAGGGGLVAVGSDSRRDYATLFEAVSIADVPIDVVCQPRNIEGLVVPRQVTVRHGVFDDAYRRLLHAADLVVTPTVAPAYPSGQSVVLEAMSMGRATLTTDSPAMRDYVDDGADGFLVAPRDPEAMARMITLILANEPRRGAVGGAAACTVRDRFTFEHLWDSVSRLMGEMSG